MEQYYQYLAEAFYGGIFFISLLILMLLGCLIVWIISIVLWKIGANIESRIQFSSHTLKSERNKIRRK